MSNKETIEENTENKLEEQKLENTENSNEKDFSSLKMQDDKQTKQAKSNLKGRWKRKNAPSKVAEKQDDDAVLTEITTEPMAEEVANAIDYKAEAEKPKFSDRPKSKRDAQKPAAHRGRPRQRSASSEGREGRKYSATGSTQASAAAEKVDKPKEVKKSCCCSKFFSWIKSLFSSKASCSCPAPSKNRGVDSRKPKPRSGTNRRRPVGNKKRPYSSRTKK